MINTIESPAIDEIYVVENANEMEFFIRDGKKVMHLTYIGENQIEEVLVAIEKAFD